MLNTQELLDLVRLEPLDVGLFRAQNLMTPWKRVFGGQVLAQALHAAYQTVPEDRICHSFHGYFILPGDTQKPIIYDVDTLRDGGSFSTRRVTARQNGRAIFIMAASFQHEENGFEHQQAKPDVAHPDTLLTDQELAEKVKEKAPGMYRRLKARQQDAIVFKPVEGLSLKELTAAQRHVWLSTKDKMKLSYPEQQQLLAFASDYDLLVAALLPHAAEIQDTSKIFLASLDHAMWFHRSFDINDWILFAINSPSAINSRGMGYGNMYSENGELICTLMQEGLIRQIR